MEAALAHHFEQAIPFNRLLAVRIESARPQDVRASFDMRADLVGSPHAGRLHGGVVASILDMLGGLAMMVGVAERHPAETAEQILHRFTRLGTIDLRVDYLRPGLGQHFIATAEVTRLGGRIGSALMRLSNQDGLLLATGAGAYVVA